MRKKNELSKRQARRLLQKVKTRYNREHPAEVASRKAIHAAKREERERAKELRAKIRAEKRKLRNIKYKERRAERFRANPRMFLRKMASWLHVPDKEQKAVKANIKVLEEQLVKDSVRAAAHELAKDDKALGELVDGFLKVDQEMKNVPPET